MIKTPSLGQTLYIKFLFNSKLTISIAKAALIFVLTLNSAFAFASPPESEMAAPDEIENPVCSATKLEKLHTNFRKLTGDRSPEQGWNLTKAMICLKGPEADRVIRGYITGDLMMRVGGPAGGPDYPVSKHSEEIRHGYGRGNAWGATVELIGNDIWVNFMTDEICWKGFTIRFDGSKWNIFELNSGCD